MVSGGRVMEKGKGIYWCNSHQREATHTEEDGTRICDPELPGILLPCRVVFLDDIELKKE